MGVDDRPDHHAFDSQGGSGEVDGDRPVALAGALRAELHLLVGDLDVASENRLVADAHHDDLSVLGSGVLAYGDEIGAVEAERVHGVVGDDGEVGWVRVEQLGHRPRLALDDALLGQDGPLGADGAEAHHGQLFVEEADPALGFPVSQAAAPMASLCCSRGVKAGARSIERVVRGSRAGPTVFDGVAGVGGSGLAPEVEHFGGPAGGCADLHADDGPLEPHVGDLEVLFAQASVCRFAPQFQAIGREPAHLAADDFVSQTENVDVVLIEETTSVRNGVYGGDCARSQQAKVRSVAAQNHEKRWVGIESCGNGGGDRVDDPGLRHERLVDGAGVDDIEERDSVGDQQADSPLDVWDHLDVALADEGCKVDIDRGFSSKAQVSCEFGPSRRQTSADVPADCYQHGFLLFGERVQGGVASRWMLEHFTALG